MVEKKSKFPVGVVAAVVILCSIAAVFLLNNFGEVGFGKSWPVLPMAVGLSLVFASYLELGLAIMGFFLLLLLAYLGSIPPFGKTWPIALIWIAVLVVVGWARDRAEKKRGQAR